MDSIWDDTSWMRLLEPEGPWRDVGRPIGGPEWQRDNTPRVVYDSGWYCRVPGKPLPPIEAFRVPKS